MKMRTYFIVLILAGAFACKKYDSGEGSAGADIILQLVDTLGVRANGTNAIKLRVTKTQKVKSNIRVVFTSNKGTVVNENQLFSADTVEAKLILAEDSGPYVIKAQIKEGDAVKVEKILTTSFQLAYPNGEFEAVVSDSAGARQNGNATVNIEFKGSGSYKSGLSVQFSSNRGVISNTIVPFTNNSAKTRLTVSQDTGHYVVTIQLKDGATVKTEKSVGFRFRPANAQAISMEVNSSTWVAGQTLIVKTLLSRDDGWPTIGREIFFESFQVNSTHQRVAIGRFEGALKVRSKENGGVDDVKLILDMPGMDTTRSLQILAWTRKDNGDSIGVIKTLLFKP